MRPPSRARLRFEIELRQAEEEREEEARFFVAAIEQRLRDGLPVHLRGWVPWPTSTAEEWAEVVAEREREREERRRAKRSPEQEQAQLERRRAYARAYQARKRAERLAAQEDGVRQELVAVASTWKTKEEELAAAAASWKLGPPRIPDVKLDAVLSASWRLVIPPGTG